MGSKGSQLSPDTCLLPLPIQTLLHAKPSNPIQSKHRMYHKWYTVFINSVKAESFC